MLRVRINYGGPASGFSVMHFNSELSTAGAAQAAADAAEAFLQEVADSTSNQQTYGVDPEVLEVSPATGQTTGVETVTASVILGQLTGEMMPQASQLLVRWRTGAFVSGREIRGRTFIPGFTAEGNEANGTPNAAVRATMQAAADQLIAGSTLCVYSPTTAGLADVSVASIWAEWAVIRGRRE